MSAAGERHLKRVRELPCLACGSQAEAHHVRALGSASTKASDFFAIPLCPCHHRADSEWTSIHGDKQMFEMLFGTEIELLARTLEMLEQ